MPFDGESLGELPRGEPLEVQLNAVGTGTVWYTMTMQYSLPGEILPARDEGLALTRRVLRLDHREQGGSEQGWRELQHGVTYRMEVSLAAARGWQQVVLDAPIPSGARILDARLQSTGTYAEPEGERPPPAVRQDYPGHARFTFEALPPGVTTVHFLFRTVNRGIYPLPSASARVVHEPEVFGRTAGVLAVIGDGP